MLTRDGRPPGGAAVTGGVDARQRLPVAAVTAAGASRRMGRSKALLPWGPGTALEAILRTASDAGIVHAAVVVADGDAAVADATTRAGGLVLVNGDPARGRFSSIRIAAAWAISTGNDARMVLWPVDCPGVATSTLAALCRASIAHPDANVAPVSAGRTGHPVVLCADTLARIVSIDGDANLRDLLHEAPGGRRLVAVDDAAVLDNLNAPGDVPAGIPVHDADGAEPS